MKTKKCYLILAVVTGILCVPAWGQVELPRLDLIGQANPTLAGIDKLYVWIVPHGFEPNSHGLVFEELENLVTDKLKEAGMKITYAIKEGFILESLDTPDLRIDINMLKFVDSQQYVFRIQTSLSRAVQLKEQSGLLFKADVWKAEPIMQVASVQNMPATVTSLVLEQVKAFIHAWLSANPKSGEPAGADGIVVSPPKQAKSPPAKPMVAEYKYVASKNSKVFHKPDCSSAKRISSKNLIGYNSRGEATKVDRRPCKRCKP